MHCRKDNHWELCLLENSCQFNDVYDCPKDARVAGNRKRRGVDSQATEESHQVRTRMLVSVVIRDHGLVSFFLFPRFVGCENAAPLRLGRMY
jgi:hypothetical protein